MWIPLSLVVPPCLWITEGKSSCFVISDGLNRNFFFYCFLSKCYSESTQENTKYWRLIPTQLCFVLRGKEKSCHIIFLFSVSFPFLNWAELSTRWFPMKERVCEAFAGRGSVEHPAFGFCLTLSPGACPAVIRNWKHAHSQRLSTLKNGTDIFPSFVLSYFVPVPWFFKLNSNLQLLKENHKNMIFNLLRFVRPCFTYKIAVALMYPSQAYKTIKVCISLFISAL